MYKTAKNIFHHIVGRGYNKNCVLYPNQTAHDVTKLICAVLYVYYVSFNDGPCTLLQSGMFLTFIV